MRNVWRLIWVLMLTGGLAMAGCGKGSGNIPFIEPGEPQAWAILSDQPAYAVVTEKNWSKYYPAPPQQANFKEKFYIVATWGLKPNPGYRLSIVSIEQSGSSLQVKLKQEEPDTKLFYPQVIVRPTAVVEISSSSLNQRGLLTFEFLDQNETTLARTEAEI